MELDEAKKVVVKMSAMTDKFDERGDKIAQAVLQAAQNMNQIAHSMPQISEKMTKQSLDVFRHATTEVLSKGLSEPIKDCDKSLQASVYKLESMAGKLEAKMLSVQHVLVTNMWKTVVASGLAIVAALIVWFFVMRNIHQEMKRSDWIGNINAAQGIGKLVACLGEGLCANINGKLTRLDK